jgi:glycine/serine hydroxymethyltransferase
MGKEEMKTIAGWIAKVIANMGDEKLQKQIKAEVLEMCSHFPVPGIDY